MKPKLHEALFLNFKAPLRERYFMEKVFRRWSQEYFIHHNLLKSCELRMRSYKISQTYQTGGHRLRFKAAWFSGSRLRRTFGNFRQMAL